MGPHPALFYTVIGLLAVCLLIISVYGIRRLQRRRIDQTPARKHAAAPPTNYSVSHAGRSGGRSGAMHNAPTAEPQRSSPSGRPSSPPTSYPPRPAAPPSTTPQNGPGHPSVSWKK